MTNNLIGLYKDFFLWATTKNTLTENEEHDIILQMLKTIFDCMPQLILRSLYVWFLVHLYVGLIPTSSGQLAVLFFSYHSSKVDLRISDGI